MTDFREQYQTAVAVAEKILRDRLNDPDITGEDCFLIITNTDCCNTVLSAIATLLRIENNFEALARYSRHHIFGYTIYHNPIIEGIAQKLVETRKHAPEEEDLTEWAWLIYRQGRSVSRNIFHLLRGENKGEDDPYLRTLLSLTALIYRHPVLSKHNEHIPKEAFTEIFIPKMRLEGDPERHFFFLVIS